MPAIFMHAGLHNDKDIVANFGQQIVVSANEAGTTFFLVQTISELVRARLHVGTIAKLLGLFLMLKYFDNIKAHPGLMRLPSRTGFHSSATLRRSVVRSIT
jgi:hypothetical protein